MTLFCLGDDKGISNDCSTLSEELLFPDRKTIRINFSDFTDGKVFGSLNRRDCTLSITLTPTQWKSSGVHAILTSQSQLRYDLAPRNSSTDDPFNPTMKVFIKRIEYEDFVSVLSRLNLRLENECEDDEHSSSVSVASKFSTRTTQVRDHIEFTTRVDSSEKLRAMTRELKALHYHYDTHSVNESQYQASSQYEQDEIHMPFHNSNDTDEGDNVDETLRSFHVDKSPSYALRRSTEGMIDSESHSKQSFQSPPRFTAVEVTPLGIAHQLNANEKSSSHCMRLNFNKNDRPLEKFASICCCFGVQEAMKMDIDDANNTDLANFISCYEEAMLNTLNSARNLHHFIHKLAAIPELNPETANTFELISKHYQSLVEGSEMWSSIRQRVEQEVFEKLLINTSIQEEK